MTRGIDDRASEELWSESYYLDAVAPDARTGFILRLARYPEHDTSWLWLHAFTPEGVFGYNDAYLPCPGVAIPEDEIRLRCAIPEPTAIELERDGAPANAVRVRAALRGHADPHAPWGEGKSPLILQASFKALRSLGGTLEGRLEVHGRVSSRMNAGGRSYEIDGWGQWHEQRQSAPRFRVGFTYLSLRGAEVSLVGVGTARGARGRAWYEGHTCGVAAIEYSPPGRRRELTARLDDGRVLSGAVETTFDYSVPIYGDRRPGTLVAGHLGEVEVSGVWNDFAGPSSPQENAS